MIKLTRHAKRRMKLYKISFEDIDLVLKNGQKFQNRDNTITFIYKLTDRKLPIKVVSKQIDNDYLVITSYPLKRGI
jgi:hypothetical protein